jgi:hypothetical protein
VTFGRHSSDRLYGIGYKKDRYKWIQPTLIRLDYDKLNRKDTGLIVRYLIKISGYSRQPLTRLISQYRVVVD